MLPYQSVFLACCVIVILLAFLIWVYGKFDSNYDSSEHTRQQTIKDTINWLYQAVNDICYKANMSPLYEIIETRLITYTDKISHPHNIKGTIYLVLWDEKHGRIFSYNTLIYAMMHEITHILSPSIHHEPPFDAIEAILLKTALQLGYYDPNLPIETNYMTLDLNQSI